MRYFYYKAIPTIICLLFLAGCSSTCFQIPEYRESFILKVPETNAYEVAIHLRNNPIKVPPNTPYELYIPMGKDCRTSCLGIPLSGPRFENRKLIHISRNGKVVKKLSLNQLRKLPVDNLGNRIIDMT